MSRKNQHKRELNKQMKRQQLLRDKFPITSDPVNDLAAIDKRLSEVQALLVGQPRQQSAPPTRVVEVVPPGVVKGLAAIATSAWRAKTKMVDPTTGEPHEAMARVYKDIERIYRHLEEIGCRIRNHTGDAYDDGQPMKVVTSEQRPQATRKYVLATLLPTIYWNDQIIQHGEIEIAVPPAVTNS